MAGPILIAVGAALMILGVISLIAWIGGKSLWFDPEAFDRRGSTQRGAMLTIYYLAAFAALVIAPLLVGGAFIVCGLVRVM
jgi:hypothetical protein